MVKENVEKKEAVNGVVVRRRRTRRIEDGRGIGTGLPVESRAEKKRKKPKEGRSGSCWGPYQRSSGIPDHYSTGLPRGGGQLDLGTKAWLTLLLLHPRNAVSHPSCKWAGNEYQTTFLRWIFFSSVGYMPGILGISTRELTCT